MSRLLAALLVLALPAGSALGGAQLAVSAAVAKSARIGLLGQPESLHVSAADIARGYIDLAQGPRLETRTNSREGLLITFDIREPRLLRAVALRDTGGTQLRLPGTSRGVLVQQVAPRLRLLLSPQARPGIYAWPVQVIASPL